MSQGEGLRSRTVTAGPEENDVLRTAALLLPACDAVPLDVRRVFVQALVLLGAQAMTRLARGALPPEDLVRLATTLRHTLAAFQLAGDIGCEADRLGILHAADREKAFADAVRRVYGCDVQFTEDDAAADSGGVRGASRSILGVPASWMRNEYLRLRPWVPRDVVEDIINLYENPDIAPKGERLCDGGEERGRRA